MPEEKIRIVNTVLLRISAHNGERRGDVRVWDALPSLIGRVLPYWEIIDTLKRATSGDIELSWVNSCHCGQPGCLNLDYDVIAFFHGGFRIGGIFIGDCSPGLKLVPLMRIDPAVGPGPKRPRLSKQHRKIAERMAEIAGKPIREVEFLSLISESESFFEAQRKAIQHRYYELLDRKEETDGDD